MGEDGDVLLTLDTSEWAFIEHGGGMILSICDKKKKYCVLAQVVMVYIIVLVI